MDTPTPPPPAAEPVEDGRRSVLFPGALWERLGAAAAVESQRLGMTVSRSDLVRQGATQRADTILGPAAGEPSP